MVSISRALRQVKGDLPRLIEQHTRHALDAFSTFFILLLSCHAVQLESLGRYS